MLSVVGLDDAALEKCVASSKTKPGQVCEIANYLFPTGRVVSGDLECLATVTTLANKAGALKISMLQVSGAFHTDRMASAALARVPPKDGARSSRRPTRSRNCSPSSSCPR